MLSIEQVQEFNDFFTRGIFDNAEPLYQSWINLKRADIDPDPNSDLGTENEENDDDEMKFGMMMMLFLFLPINLHFF